MKEVHGSDKEPWSRLCPLGWTAISAIGTPEGHLSYAAVREYWWRTELFTDTRLKASGLCDHTAGEGATTFPEEKLTTEKVNESIRFDGEMHDVIVYWKHSKPELLSIRQMAEKCCRTVEKKLMKNKRLAQVLSISG